MIKDKNIVPNQIYRESEPLFYRMELSLHTTNIGFGIYSMDKTGIRQKLLVTRVNKGLSTFFSPCFSMKIVFNYEYWGRRGRGGTLY
jgi:hypothetical protein